MAILRIGVGIFLLMFGQYKVFYTQFALDGSFPFWINRSLEQGGAYSFMIPSASLSRAVFALSFVVFR